MIDILRHFIPHFLAGFTVNLKIALFAVIIGLACGIPLAVLRQKLTRFGWLVRACIRLMQAAPTYVVMFFMLNLLPRNTLLDRFMAAGLAAVILSQAVYLTAYVAENFFRSLEHMQRNEREHALLFIPSLLRGFIVVVMSSGFGAAVGVSEAVATTMRQAETLELLWQRIVLFVFVIGFFIAVFITANAMIQRMYRSLAGKA